MPAPSVGRSKVVVRPSDSSTTVTTSVSVSTAMCTSSKIWSLKSISPPPVFPPPLLTSQLIWFQGNGNSLVFPIIVKKLIIVFNTSQEPKTQTRPQTKSHNLLLASVMFFCEPPEKRKRKPIYTAIKVTKEVLIKSRKLIMFCSSL